MGSGEILIATTNGKHRHIVATFEMCANGDAVARAIAKHIEMLITSSPKRIEQIGCDKRRKTKIAGPGEQNRERQERKLSW